jgi:hypothetical protein
MALKKDIAPTICALLDIPVTRQGQGIFIDDVLMLIRNYNNTRKYYQVSIDIIILSL